jgi:hypothetical protein
MERTLVESSTVRSVGYADGTLEIEFVNGSVYQYFDVPEPIYQALLNADTHGGFFNQQIRGHFRYART